MKLYIRSFNKYLIKFRKQATRVGSNSSLNVRMMSIISENLESLGDSITTAVLLSWNKEPGDSIKEDDVIAVVETDKVSININHQCLP